MTERDIPHGHGLSFKRGVSDGLLEESTYDGEVHETHRASYQRGVEEGVALRVAIADRVRE